MSIPSSVIYYLGYESLRDSMDLVLFKDSDLKPYSPALAGSISRLLAVTAISPLELLRTRMQASTGIASAGGEDRVLQGVARLIREQGALSLWKGLGPTLWRDVPFSGKLILFFNLLHLLFDKFNDKKPCTGSCMTTQERGYSLAVRILGLPAANSIRPFWPDVFLEW